jgi:hypothetical protein
MAKINPALDSDFTRLLDKVDECGKMARSLIGKGLDVGDIKKGVSRRFGVKLGTYGATKIVAGILSVW